LLIFNVDQETKTVEPAAQSKEQKVTSSKSDGNIYVGFDKSDTQPREGRRGRTIADDEEKYPSRSELVGGWAGGEVGLQQFVQVRSRQAM
jgi:hypothetical protein